MALPSVPLQQAPTTQTALACNVKSNGNATNLENQSLSITTMSNVNLGLVNVAFLKDSQDWLLDKIHVDAQLIRRLLG